MGIPAQSPTPPKSRVRTPTYHNYRMVQRRSIKAQGRNIQLSKAVLGVQTRKFKSAYTAAKALGLRPDTKQQLLSKNQEKTLLKWIKELTASGYAPTY
ncbi:hypothetical protein V499_00001 [Pseudogymnoascus sp. VKM F-103]|nr:hypothetical protein V499_00001 [Pseudogymnoascus sp. VKM F-103]